MTEPPGGPPPDQIGASAPNPRRYPVEPAGPVGPPAGPAAVSGPRTPGPRTPGRTDRPGTAGQDASEAGSLVPDVPEPGTADVPDAQVPDAQVPGGQPPDTRPGLGRDLLELIFGANAVTVTVLAILLALVLGGILIVISNSDLMSEYGYFFAAPGTVLADSARAVGGAYANLFKGAIVDPAQVTGAIDGRNSVSSVFGPISETLTYTAPLLFTGLAVALAFRGGMFNIGAQGQAVIGAIGGALVGFDLHLPYGAHVLVALLGALAGGAIWAGIAGVLKARTGAHEVIVTIMLNYVAQYFLNWIINQKGVHDPTRTDAISKKVHATAQLPTIPGTGLRVHLGIALAVLAAAGVGWLLRRSTVGFQLRAVGANPAAARTAGMSVGRTYVVVMVLAGALAGLGGAMQVLGSTASSLTGQVTGSIGFDGITVALLGRARPWGVVASALLFGALHAGGVRMQSYSHVAIDLVTVVQAVIVICIAAPALVKAIFRLRAGRAGGSAADLAKGW